MASHEGSLDDLCRRARAAFRDRDEPGALALLEQACTRFADDPRPWRDAAGLHFALGDADAALACLDRAAAVSATPADEIYEKGVMLARLERRDLALASYREVVRLDPQHADAWINMGAILDDRGEPMLAIDCYDHAIATVPTDAMAWANRGNSLAQLGRFDEALASYDRAIGLGDDRADGLRARMLVHAGRIAEANRARPRDPADDRGEARERRHPRGLVARYFIGRHSNPELLDHAVEQFLELTARCADTPKGIRDGSVLQIGWAAITLVRDGDDLVLCEPDWNRDPRRCVIRELTFCAQQQAMSALTHELMKAGFEDCSCHDTLLVEPDALGSPRAYMRRLAAAKDGASGWLLACTRDGDPESAPIPMSALASVRPHLLKVVALPVGYCVQFDEHAATSAWDATGRLCFSA